MKSTAGAAIIGQVILFAILAVGAIGLLTYSNQRHVAEAERIVKNAEAHLGEYDDNERLQIQNALLDTKGLILKEGHSLSIAKIKTAATRLNYLVTTLPKGTGDKPLPAPLLVVHLGSQWDQQKQAWRSDTFALAPTWFLLDATNPPGADGNVRIEGMGIFHIDQGPWGPYNTKSSLRGKLEQLGILDQYPQYRR